MELINAEIVDIGQQKWLLEFDRFTVYTSKNEIAGILPKQKGTKLNNYWDDMTMAGLNCNKDRPYLVFGSGLCSFLPLLRCYNQNGVVYLYDLSQKINNLAKKYVDSVLNNQYENRWFSCDVTNLQDIPLEHASSLFIDLYLNESVAPIVFDYNFHEKIAERVQDDFLMFTNIYHGIDKAVEKLNFYYDRVKRLYTSHRVIFRKNASTVISSLLKPRDLDELLKEMINQMQLNIDIQSIGEASCGQLVNNISDFSFQKESNYCEPLRTIIDEISKLDYLTIIKKL